MIKTIQQTIYRHGYLVITAAWLFTVSFIISNYWSYNSSPKKVQAKLQDHLVAKEQKFNAIVSNTFFLNTLLGDTADNTLSRSKLFNEEFGIFIYSINDTGNPILVYWNSNRYYLEQTDIKKADGNYFVDYQNGDFELIKKTIWLKGKKAFVIGLLPVRWDYFIDNKYLTAHFDGYPDLDKQYQIITDTAAFHIHSAELRKELFKIKFREGKTFAGYDLLTIILRVIALMLLLLFINEVAQDISKEKNAKTGFLFLLLTVFALRLITYKMTVPFDFTQLELFDPSIYASDFIHPSLGDLLINVVLAYWLVHFYKQYVHQPLFEFGEKSRRYLNFIAIVLFVYTCFFIVSIIRSMVLDSKISFDVTNIFSLDIYTIVSFVILCLLVLLFFELSHIIIRPVATRQIPLTTLLIVVAVAGLTYLTLQISSPFTVANIFVLGWLLLYFVILYFRAKEISLSIIQSPFFIFWVMYFAISVAAILINENKQVELLLRKKIAENFSVQTDPVGEELLNIATQNLKDEFIAANFFRFKNERKNKFFKDSLTEANFSGYLNKYDTRIYLYDELFHPLYNDDSTKFATIRTLVLTQGKSTGIKDLYSYEATGEQLSYLFEKISKTGDKINGYMYILIKPKQYLSEAVYPELFRQSNDLTSGLNLNYAYSIYHNGKLITRFNDYNFPQQINEKKIPPSTYLQKNNEDYNELWYNAGNGKTV